MIRCAGMLNINNHPMPSVFGKKIKARLDVANRRIELLFCLDMINLHRQANNILSKGGKNFRVAKSLLENNTIF